MIYRPKLTFTEMCIFIDNHKYDEDVDKDLIYTYLYYLAYSTAKKNKAFHNGIYYKESEYDDFALYFASILFIRIYHKKHLKEIKSIKNYINNIYYFIKVNFNTQEGNYQQSFSGDDDFLKNYYRDALTQDNKQRVKSLMLDELSELPKYILEYIGNTPYRDNKVICKNMYISCLLSIIDSLTLSNSEKNKLDKKLDAGNNVDINLSKEEVILYQLPFDMKPIIQLINRKAKKKLLENLRDILSVNSQTEYEIEKSLLDIYGDWDVVEKEELNM